MKQQILFFFLATALVTGGCQAVNERALAEMPQEGGAKVLNDFVPESELLPYV